MKQQVSKLLFLSCLFGLFAVTLGTLSITIADTESKQVAIGTVTCLTNYDLIQLLPVVVVGKGVAASQSSVDSDGRRRLLMFNGFFAEVSPDEIFASLVGLPGHQSRQYGMVDTAGRQLTFTGTQCGAWAGGLRGTHGTLAYAIQGNVITGSCVISAIEDALLDDSLPDIPARLMAGMQAAKEMGGDGRCSCSQGNPPGCGCPPSMGFSKSGHIGGMIVARPGDTDTPSCGPNGCANGNYWMKLNVAYQGSTAPDAVDQLQELYDDWRRNDTLQRKQSK